MKKGTWVRGGQYSGIWGGIAVVLGKANRMGSLCGDDYLRIELRVLPRRGSYPDMEVGNTFDIEEDHLEPLSPAETLARAWEQMEEKKD
jgi:hypothetical protein